MDSKLISIDANTIVLRTIPIRRFATIILTTIIGIGILLPIAFTVIIAREDGMVPPGILISYLIFWGVSFYMARMLSWNSSGYETIARTHDSITLLPKSKHFSFSAQTLGAKNVIYSIEPYRLRKVNGTGMQTGTLVITSNDTTITSSVELPMEDLEQLLKALTNKNLKTFR